MVNDGHFLVNHCSEMRPSTPGKQIAKATNMVQQARRTLGPILIAVVATFLYMEAVNHNGTWSMLGDYMQQTEPLDSWTRFPKGM